MAGQIADEVKTVIDAAYSKALELLPENRDKLAAVAEFLLKHENMTGEQFKTLMEGQNTTVEEATETE